MLIARDLCFFVVRRSDIIFRMVEKDVFQRFLASPLYKSMLAGEPLPKMRPSSGAWGAGFFAAIRS